VPETRTVENDDEHFATLAGVDEGRTMFVWSARTPLEGQGRSKPKSCSSAMTAFTTVMATPR
jgi:hypothetical protein